MALPRLPFKLFPDSGRIFVLIYFPGDGLYDSWMKDMNGMNEMNEWLIEWNEMALSDGSSSPDLT